MTEMLTMLTHPKQMGPLGPWSERVQLVLAARMILPGIEPGCPLPSGAVPEPNVRGLQFSDLRE